MSFQSLNGALHQRAFQDKLFNKPLKIYIKLNKMLHTFLKQKLH